MNQSEKKMTPAPPEGNVLSIPNIMLEAAGIPKDSDPTVELSLIHISEPTRRS